VANEKRVDLVLNVSANAGGAAGGLGQLDARLAGLQATVDKLAGAVTGAGKAADDAAKTAKQSASAFDKWAGAAGAVGGYAANTGKNALGAAAGAVGALTAAVRFEDALQRVNYEFLTGREKLLGFAEAIPLVGSAIKNVISSTLDAADRLSAQGSAKQLARDELTLGPDTARSQTRAAFDRQRYSIAQAGLMAGYGAEALGALPSLASERARDVLQPARGRVARGADGLPVPLFGGSGLAATTGAALLGGAVGPEDERLTAANEALRTAQRGEMAARLAADASAGAVTRSRGTRDTAMGELRLAQTLADEQRNGLLRPGAGAVGRNDYSRLRSEGNSVVASAFGFGVGVLNDLGHGIFGSGENPLDQARRTKDAASRGGGTGNRIDALAAMNNEVRALTIAQNALADLEQKVTTNKERQLDLLKKQHDVAKAQTDVMRAQLSILSDELAKTKTGARQFGAMDDFNKEGITAAYQRFKEGGRQAVSAGELALLQGNALTADEVNKKLEKDTANDPKFKEFLKQVGGRDIETIEAERKKLKAEIDLKVQLDEEKFAKLMEAKLKELNLKDILGDIIKAQFELKMREISTGADRGRIERS